MARTGCATLPLHPGKAPPWLFGRMVKLAEAITETFVVEYSPEEFLRRVSDPFWFQAFACVLGFDWHSSGTTTVTCGALKEAINPRAQEFGIAVAGGKGKSSRKAPLEIRKFGGEFGIDPTKLEYASRMAAKVDSAAVQDGHQLYHHILIMTDKSKWSVVQQGLHAPPTGETTADGIMGGTARRYHWLSDDVESFVEEPHDGILGDAKVKEVLDMTAGASRESRKTALDLICDNPAHLKEDWARLAKPEKQTLLEEWSAVGAAGSAGGVGAKKPAKFSRLDMPRNVDWDAMKRLYDFQPRNYERIIAEKGIGPATVRALALISELIYGAAPSWKDPMKYTFTVGGKDGVPYPVDRRTMDRTTEIMREGIEKAQLGEREKMDAMRRLRKVLPE